MNPLVSELNHLFGKQQHMADQALLEDAVLDIVTFLCVRGLLGVHENEAHALVFVTGVMDAFLIESSTHERVPEYIAPLRYYLTLQV
jgi:hypothetical protein